MKSFKDFVTGGWSKIGDKVRGSVVLKILNGDDHYFLGTPFAKIIRRSTFKLIEIDLETAKEYKAYTDGPYGLGMIDPDKEANARRNNIVYDSLLENPPIVLKDGDIADGNHRIDRAIKLKMSKIPILKQL